MGNAELLYIFFFRTPIRSRKTRDGSDLSLIDCRWFSDLIIASVVVVVVVVVRAVVVLICTSVVVAVAAGAP